MTTISTGRTSEAIFAQSAFPAVETRLTGRQIDAASVAELADVVATEPGERGRIERRLLRAGRSADIYTLSRAIYRAGQAEQASKPGPAQNEAPGTPKGTPTGTPPETLPEVLPGSKPSGEAPPAQAEKPSEGSLEPTTGPTTGEEPLPPEIAAALEGLDAETAARIERILGRINTRFLHKAWQNVFTMLTTLSGQTNSLDDWASFDDQDRERQRDQAAAGVRLAGDRLVVTTADGESWSIDLTEEPVSKARTQELRDGSPRAHDGHQA